MERNRSESPHGGKHPPDGYLKQYELVGMLIESPIRLAIARQLVTSEQPLSGERLKREAAGVLRQAGIAPVATASLTDELRTLIAIGLVVESRGGYRLTAEGRQAAVLAATPLPPFVDKP